MLKALFRSFLVFSFFSQFAFATTYVVDDDYSAGWWWWGYHAACEDDGASENNTYRTIKDAVNAATSNWNNQPHTIRICPGTYNENDISLDSTALNSGTITSTTDNPSDVVISDNSRNPIFEITSYLTNFTIKNLTINQSRNNDYTIHIRSGGSGYTFDNLVLTSRGHAIYQENGTFANTIFKNLEINALNDAVYLASPSNIVFQDINVTSSSQNALSFGNPVGEITITTQDLSYNTLTSSDDAIVFSDSIQNYTVENTKLYTSSNNAIAVNVEKANNLTIDNVFIDTAGIGKGIYISTSVNKLDVQNSTFTNINAENIFANAINSTGSIIKSNIMDSGSRGIYIESFSNPITIQNNLIENMTYAGLYLLDSFAWRGSQIDNNCFINNAIQAYSRDNSANFDNGSRGNYWSDWSGSGSYTIQSIPRYDNYPLSSCPYTTAPQPIVDYRFDECTWDGTSGEVKDSSVNESNATTFGATLATDSTDVVMNHAATFDGSSYIEVGDISALRNTATLSFWIKTTQVGNNTTWIAPGIIGVEQSGANDDIIWGYIDGSGRIGLDIGTTSGTTIYTSSAINNGQYHHIVISRDKDSGEAKIYLDGVLESSKTLKTGTIGTTFTQLGVIRDTGGTPTYFQGILDEVKVYDSILNAAEILDIYNNESAGKNYDGNTRDAINCAQLGTCFYDNFENSNLGSIWSIIKNQNYTPSISDGKLMLTPNQTWVSTGVTISGEFPSNDNLVEIEFEHNAYGGNGADGMTVVLSDANVTPIAGAYGGSLGYAPKYGDLGFAGAWLGFGLDEFGNFADDDDGNKGRDCVSPYENTTRILDSITVRGRGNSDRLNGYCFLANSGNLLTDTGVGIDDTSSSTPAPQVKYKFVIDTRNSETRLSVYRDINDGNGYVVISSMDDIDVTQQATAPDNFKLSLTASTGGSRNYHSLDDIKISALDCGTLGYEPTPEQTKFDAWNADKTWESRIITTKIASQDFTLTVGSLNETFSGVQDFNGTVCAQLVDDTNTSLSSYQKLLFTDELEKSVTFNSSSASKNARVHMIWKSNEDVACESISDYEEGLSSDNFAIRPKSFSISSASDLYAGESFSLDFKALDNDNVSANGYNETRDTSFEVTSTNAKSICPSGTLNIPSFSFVDGVQSVAMDYSENGDVNITIAEILGSEFAVIDDKSGDTESDADRLIPTLIQTITVKPYELNVTVASFDASNSQDWLYMADVNDMNVTASATVQANNKQHVALQNFTSTCYASDVDLSFYYSVTNPNSDVNISYAPSSLGTNESIASLNKTLTIPASSFTSSSASTQYSFNVNRAYNTPLNPIDIMLTDVKVTSIDVAKDENNATLSENKIFYYGRVSTKDITTNQQSITHPTYIEVYSTSKLGSWKQDSINWYRMEDDGLSSFVAIAPKSDFLYSSSDKTLSTTPSTSSGVIDTTITNSWSSSGDAFIHLDIPEYLWYNRYSDYNATNSCSTHPCFRYIYKKQNQKDGVNSGVFDGSSIVEDRNYTGGYEKSGVKVFR